MTVLINAWSKDTPNTLTSSWSWKIIPLPRREAGIQDAMHRRKQHLIGLSVPILFGIGVGCLDLQTSTSSGGGGQAGMDASSSSTGTGGGGQTSSSSSGTSSGGPDADTPGMVYCNDLPCGQGAICCFDPDLPKSSACDAPGGCITTEVEVPCDGPSDCKAGQVCCGHFGGGWFDQVSCRADCTGTNDVIFCSGTGVCPAGKSCKPSPILGKGYSVCY